jgi:predicted dehydrogenase
MQNFVIFGFGLIGRQRRDALLKYGIQPENVFVVDPYIATFPEDVQVLSDTTHLDQIKPGHIIVSTPHDVALELISRISQWKPRILLEKPMGRNFLEAEKIEARLNGAELSIGFNYRFMEGIKNLKAILDKNELGEINSIRMDLGHGGSPGDEKKWKLNLNNSGGGSLLDPGIHLIDLILYLFNGTCKNLLLDGGNVWSGFWNTGIEESSMVVGKINNIPFQFTSSIVSWRTRFRIEVIGVDGYVIVNGRGRSEGPQTIVSGKRWGWQSGISQTESEQMVTCMRKDNSIEIETQAWLNRDISVANLSNGLEAMKAYEKIVKGVTGK